VVLNVGEIIAEGSVDAVVADPEVRRAYLGRSA
jgi:ABC-type branched-subunit amino acid transport system ATPase component